jgi:hypothetical protein
MLKGLIISIGGKMLFVIKKIDKYNFVYVMKYAEIVPINYL